MPTPFFVDDFKGKIDSLYRNESHGFGAAARARKSTVTALEEILDSRVGYFVSDEEEEHFLE